MLFFLLNEFVLCFRGWNECSSGNKAVELIKNTLAAAVTIIRCIRNLKVSESIFIK